MVVLSKILFKDRRWITILGEFYIIVVFVFISRKSLKSWSDLMLLTCEIYNYVFDVDKNGKYIDNRRDKAVSYNEVRV